MYSSVINVHVDSFSFITSFGSVYVLVLCRGLCGKSIVSTTVTLEITVLALFSIFSLIILLNNDLFAYPYNIILHNLVVFSQYTSIIDWMSFLMTILYFPSSDICNLKPLGEMSAFSLSSKNLFSLLTSSGRLELFSSYFPFECCPFPYYCKALSPDVYNLKLSLLMQTFKLFQVVPVHIMPSRLH